MTSNAEKFGAALGKAVKQTMPNDERGEAAAPKMYRTNLARRAEGRGPASATTAGSTCRCSS